MNVLTQIQDISYGLAERDDAKEMIDMLASVFSRFDPPAVAVGLSYDQFRELAMPYAQRAPGDALTVIARHQPSGKLVGAMLTDDFASPPPATTDKLPENFKPIAALLEELDGQYRNVQLTLPGQTLHLFLLGVDSDFGGRGIARALVQLTLDNGLRKGYANAITEATGNVSQHIFRNYGFVERFRIPYKEFLHQGRCVFENITEHEGILLMERKLHAE